MLNRCPFPQHTAAASAVGRFDEGRVKCDCTWDAWAMLHFASDDTWSTGSLVHLNTMLWCCSVATPHDTNPSLRWVTGV